MMISPESYKEQLNGLTLEEVISKRDKLIESIKVFENNDNTGNDDFTKPDSKTKYLSELEYLKVVIDAIIELKEEKTWTKSNVISNAINEIDNRINEIKDTEIKDSDNNSNESIPDPFQWLGEDFDQTIKNINSDKDNTITDDKINENNCSQ